MTARSAVDGAHLAAQLLHDGVDDVHAQAGTALATLGGEKRFKHVFAHGRRQADAVVGKVQQQPARSRVIAVRLDARAYRDAPRAALRIAVAGTVH
ncbi:hypothetical protein D3C87_919460 [compost metagenome]